MGNRNRESRTVGKSFKLEGRPPMLLDVIKGRNYFEVNQLFTHAPPYPFNVLLQGKAGVSNDPLYSKISVWQRKEDVQRHPGQMVSLQWPTPCNYTFLECSGRQLDLSFTVD